MACGCPVVASRIPTTMEIAEDCPIYFDVQRSEAFVEALDRALEEQRDQRRCENGLKLVHKYSWDDTARQTLSVYRELC